MLKNEVFSTCPWDKSKKTSIRFSHNGFYMSKSLHEAMLVLIQ